MGAKIKNISLTFTGEAIMFLKNFHIQKKRNNTTSRQSLMSLQMFSKAFKGPLEILEKQPKDLES